jgi:hypothetical protein
MRRSLRRLVNVLVAGRTAVFARFGNDYCPSLLVPGMRAAAPKRNAIVALAYLLVGVVLFGLVGHIAAGLEAPLAVRPRPACGSWQGAGRLPERHCSFLSVNA